MNAFDREIKKRQEKLTAEDISSIQVNVGLLCNLECKHCHLSCGPERSEIMDWNVMKEIVKISQNYDFELIDITGGSPELNPHLKKFIKNLSREKNNIQIRTNLVSLLEQNCSFADFYRKYNVNLVASLPCYTEENVEAQRGKGVFGDSIKALEILNSLGYGTEEGPELNLVYNPGGDFLPPDQTSLKRDYKKELSENYDIKFNNLWTITNMPIGRWRKELESQGRCQAYIELLKDSFNSDALNNLMCKSQISVRWDGKLFDCDFNIALDLPIDEPNNIFSFDDNKLKGRNIITGTHCFGCTAGSGSSCGGSIY